MSASTARWIERKCGKPEGWLEHDAESARPEAADRLKMRSAVALLRALASLKLAPADLAQDADALAIAYNFIVSSPGSDT